jgi:cell division protein FtsQ
VTNGRKRDRPRGSRLPAGWKLSVIGLLAVLLAAWWVTRSSIFEARSVTVRGNHHLSRADILELAGVGPQTNVVWFSPGRAAERLERSPWILSADVSRALPSTLAISVRERTAIALVKGERTYVVASDRTILQVSESPTDLPEIDAPSSPLIVGELLPSPSPGLQVLEAMPASLRVRVDRVSLDRAGVLLVNLKGGIRAIYGDASQAGAKADAVQALLRYAARHDVRPERLDVRAPGHPALLPAEDEASIA